MYYHRFFLCVIATILATSAYADELADKMKAITDLPEYTPARWGMLVVDAKTGKTIYEREPDRFFLPASVTKLYSCASALQELGPDHRFRTSVYALGEIKDGVLAGDLVLVASGDLILGGRRSPSGKTLFQDSDHTYANGGSFNAKLTDSDPLYALKELAKQLGQRGIKEIRGDVLIDDRLFARARSTGSGPEVLTPIVVNDNVIDVLVTPTAEGEAAKVQIRPATSAIQVTPNIKTITGDGALVIIRETKPGEYRITGSIGVNAPPAVRIIDVTDPTMFARTLFIETLRAAQIKVSADDRKSPQALPDQTKYKPLIPVATYVSEPLADVLVVTLKVSHNLYASTLPILVGHKHGVGTIERGLRQQGKVLEQLGVDPKTVSFAGGAGGAQADSVTPRATVKLLQAMANHPHATTYFNALPLLGVDGTLAEVVSKDSPARGHVRAKTGTLSWTDALNSRQLMRSKALAGELVTAKGTKLYFAIFLNDVPLEPGNTTAQQGKVLGRICELLYQHGP